MKYQLGIIGAGNMCYAIVSKIVASNKISSDKIIVSDISTSSFEKFKRLNVNCTLNNDEVLENCEFLLFAVKPQSFTAIELKNIPQETSIVSIMAGIGTSKILNSLNKNHAVCRIMPNTPCMVGEGMLALYYKNYSVQNKNYLTDLFSVMGKVLIFEDESKFDAITSVSGSGNAYVYMFIQSMIKGGMQGGLTESESLVLTLQTFKGAIKMIEEDVEKNIDQLIANVCSKGGTTIQAIEYYRNNQLPEIIMNGMERCRKRSEELSAE